jgi:alkyl hydroperoxide reductase subunit D
MTATEALLDALPDAGRDLRLNLAAVLAADGLEPARRWGVAIAAAIAARDPELRAALEADARAVDVGSATIDDARAAAALMAMNNVYYRFRHLVGKPSYADRPARLRMQRLGRPATTKADLELFSLAVSAIHGCGTCVQAHERVVLEAGMTEDQVHDAVRIAAVVHGVAIARTLPAAGGADLPR